MLYQLSYFPIPWKRRVVYQKSPSPRKGVFANHGEPTCQKFNSTPMQPMVMSFTVSGREDAPSAALASEETTSN